MQSSSPHIAERRLHLAPKAIAYAVFVPTGLITVLLGPLLPMLSARWSLNDTQAGYLVTAQFIGSLLSTVSSSIVLPRFGFRRSIASGLLLMAIGAATLGAHGFVWGVVSVFCYGTGIGLTVPVGNLLVASATPEHRSSSLNLLNFFWSAGAMICPFLLAVFRHGRQDATFLVSLAAVLVLLVVVLLTVPIAMPQPNEEHPRQAQHSRLRYLLAPTAIVLEILFFVYVGTESSIGIWLASYAKRISGTQSSEWITAPSYFYGALLLGRLAAPIILRRLSDVVYARLSAVLAVFSVGALLCSRSFISVVICAALAGIGLSTLYPTMIGYLSASFGAVAPRIAGTMFALSTLGAASIPWLVGFLSTHFGSLRISMGITLAGTLLMLSLFCVKLPVELKAGSGGMTNGGRSKVTLAE